MSLDNIYLGDTESINKAYLGDTVVFTRGNVDASTQSLLDQATSDGYTSASGVTLTALDTFITTGKSDGWWDLIQAGWLPATNGDSNFACYNIKDPTQFNLTKVNSPTFTSGEGFTGNGTSSYLNTNFNPSVNSVNYTQNSASVGVYNRVNSDDENIIGLQASTSNRTIINPSNSAKDSTSYSINGSSLTTSLGDGTGQGFYHANRSSANNIQLYKNSATLSSVTNNASQSLINNNFYLLCRNNGGTAQAFSTGQISFAFIGGDLSSQATNLYNAIQTYMTSIGKQV